MNFRAILDTKYDDHVKKVAVLIAAIKSAKQVSTVVRVLNSKLPLPTLQHLKRVKRVDGEFWIVLDHAPPEEPLEKRQKPNTCVLEKISTVRELLGEVKEIEVPAEGPKTRAQYQKCMELWPVNFHPEQRVEQFLSSEMFDSEEQSWHEECLGQVLKKAESCGNNAAMVADPVRRVVVAVGVDRREHHPLLHAVMGVVEEVAATQRDKETVAKGKPLNSQQLQEPYLCTGWDVYLAREPCPMCAMALVHSRASRVFFVSLDPNVGALVSCCQMQFIKDLNHHYQVFHVSPAETCG